jgi:preprotein translocase subunit SecE
VPSKSAAKQVKKQPNAFSRFFRETMGELRRVSWPTRQEAWKLSQIVWWVVFAMAIFFGVILDSLFFEFFNYIFSL